MSHVTLEQAKHLRKLGYPQPSTEGFLWSTGDNKLHTYEEMIDMGLIEPAIKPSAEELMEWLANELKQYDIVYRPVGVWCVDGHKSPKLIDALYYAVCLVLEQEQKNLAP